LFEIILAALFAGLTFSALISFILGKINVPGKPSSSKFTDFDISYLFYIARGATTKEAFAESKG